LEAGPGQSSAMLTVSFATGKAVIVNTEGGGKASLAISGDIVDESGTMLGDLVSVCERAPPLGNRNFFKSGCQFPHDNGRGMRRLLPNSSFFLPAPGSCAPVELKLELPISGIGFAAINGRASTAVPSARGSFWEGHGFQPCRKAALFF
jgi:hypothetical protein